MPKETPRAAAAFADYCALGPGRSLAKLAARNGDTPSKIRSLKRQYEAWSSEHGWQERVKLYDRERAEERRLKLEAEIEAMNARHAGIGQKAAEQAIQQIERLMAAQEFGSYAAVQLLKISTDLERLARGAPTERQELTGKDGEPVASFRAVFVLPALDNEEEEQGPGNGSRTIAIE